MLSHAPFPIYLASNQKSGRSFKPRQSTAHPDIDYEFCVIADHIERLYQESFKSRANQNVSKDSAEIIDLPKLPSDQLSLFCDSEERKVAASNSETTQIIADVGRTFKRRDDAARPIIKFETTNIVPFNCNERSQPRTRGSSGREKAWSTWKNKCPERRLCSTVIQSYTIPPRLIQLASYAELLESWQELIKGPQNDRIRIAAYQVKAEIIRRGARL